MQNRIKELREKREISQEELANEVNLSNQVISFYENGKREPKIEKWQKLADYFNVSVPYLQGYVDEYIDIHDLNEEEQEAYNRITDMLCEEYPEDSISWSKIGQLLINSAEEQKMEKVVYREEICGRIAVVKEMDMPFGRYYTGYIEILHKDPFSWRNHVEMGKELFFDSWDEFEEFPGGVTFAGSFPDIESEEGFVGFDTEPFTPGEYTEEDCIDILKKTANILAIRTRAAQEAIASKENSEPKNKSDKKSKNVGLLLEAVNDLANASAFNERDKKDKVSERLDSAGKNVTLFLVNELHVKPSDIAMFTILKTVLSEDDEDE